MQVGAQSSAATTGPRAPPTGHAAELRLFDVTGAFTPAPDLIAYSEVVKRRLCFGSSTPSVEPIQVPYTQTTVKESGGRFRRSQRLPEGKTLRCRIWGFEWLLSHNRQHSNTFELRRDLDIKARWKKWCNHSGLHQLTLMSPPFAL